ncbi:MAG TPA: glycosyltransferase family 2 protein [Patescibacteria group bacterium]|nr:glycosyltransferase family 2 protein [Patescibacteria group bacterium]
MKEKQTKVAVNLVTYNAEKYLPFCLKSVFDQTFADFSLLVIDNGSNDQTLPYLKENWPQLKVVANGKNVGFAKAHNQGIAWTRSDYVLLLNQDVILEKDYLAKAVEYLEEHPGAGCLGGRMLSWDFQNNVKTNIIDSAGLRIFKNHRVLERGQGEINKNQYGEIQEVFGVSGALPLYRRLVLEKIKVCLNPGLAHAEYFDEDFFSYKEDVDIAYRLRLAGFTAVYFPEATAYHDRSVKAGADLSDRAVKASRKHKDKMVKVYSYKNHLLALFKNEFRSNLIRFFWPIFWYEFKKLVFILFFEQSTLRGVKMFLAQRKNNRQKRKYIFKQICKIQPKDLAKWYE